MTTLAEIPNHVSEAEGKEVTEIAVHEWLAKAKQWHIQSAGDYLMASEFLKEILANQKRVETVKKGPAKITDDAHKAVLAFFNKFLIPLKEAETVMRGLMKAYADAEDRKRRAEEERIRREQEAMAAEEREKATMAALAKGDTEAAAEAAEKPVDVAPVVIAPTTPKAEGVTLPKVWKGNCLDVIAVCKGIAEGRVPFDVVDVRAAQLNKFAASKGKEGVFDGIRCTHETQVRVS